MKDNEKISLIAVDEGRRITEEIKVASAKGFKGLSESLDI